MSKRSEKLTAGLASIDDIRQRIELVAADFKSGKRKYASIDSWKLGELLGLDFDATSDWSHHFLASRQELADSGFEHPFAENIRLLEGKVPPGRYKKLSALARAIEEDSDRADLPLTGKEADLLREAYAEDNAGPSDVTLATTTLRSAAGVELDFEVCIGDGGEAYDARSPYDLEKGKGLDGSDYVHIEG